MKWLFRVKSASGCLHFKCGWFNYFLEDDDEARWLLSPRTLNKMFNITACQKPSVAGISCWATAPLNTSGTTQPQASVTNQAEKAITIAASGIQIRKAIAATATRSPQPLYEVFELDELAEAPVNPRMPNRMLSLNAWTSDSDAGKRPFAIAVGKTCGTTHPHTSVVIKAETTTKMTTRAIAPRQPRPISSQLFSFLILFLLCKRILIQH